MPNHLIGAMVAVTESGGQLLITDTATGELVADHAQSPWATPAEIHTIRLAWEDAAII